MPIRTTRRLWLDDIQEGKPAPATEIAMARPRLKEIVHVDNNE
jgi:hypothetical protein